MTRGLENVDWKNVLFVDIETAREQKTLNKGDAIYDMVEWKFRNFDTGTVLPLKELREVYYKEGGLHPELCKIVCISVGYLRKGKIRIFDIVKESEKEMIQIYLNVVKGRIPAGHNVKRFDIPIIRLRALKNGIHVPMNMSDVGLKPWEIGTESNSKFKLIDSMDLIRGSYAKNISLVAACYLTGVPSPKSDINGSQVSECYYNGEIDRIAKYCGRDVVSVANVILTLAGKDTVEVDDEYGKPQEQCLMTIIYDAKDISDEDKTKLKEKLDKKKLTKKDKVVLKEMLEALIIHTPFMAKGDSKDEIKSKEELIEQFISTLK